MSKNKLFKVFIMIAFIMCSCEDNFDPKMYGTLNVSNYPVTEAEYESFMMTCYMPYYYMDLLDWCRYEWQPAWLVYTCRRRTEIL